jgi:outer membrane protein assembly factor BamA
MGTTVPFMPFTIDSIHIEGNTKTRASVILRELSFEQDSTYDYNNFQHYHIPRSVANLKNLDLFNDITIDFEAEGDDKGRSGKVIITLLEKNYLWPLPFVEFADRNLNQWYSLDLQPYRTNFGLYLFKNNVWGLNHTAKFTFGFGYTNTLAFQYIAPYIDKKKKLGFDIDIRQKTNREVQLEELNDREVFYRDFDRNLIRSRWVKTRWRYRPKLYLNHLVELNAESLNVDSIITFMNPDFLRGQDHTQQLYSVRYGVDYAKVNNILFPMQGVAYNIMVGGHSLANAFDYGSIESGLALYTKLPFLSNERLFAALTGYMSHKTSDQLPYNLNKALGYDHYVRGYENNIFLGPTYGYLKYELRYLIIKERDFHLRYMPLKAYKDMVTKSYLSIFIDDGGTPDRRLTGYGIGLNTVFYYDKVFRFEYSWNKEGDSGVKIHLEKAF